jgi:propionyl-CoA synthetase
VQIVNEKGEVLGPNQEGIVAVRTPLPPACLPTLWNNDKRFKESYMDPFPGFYFTGDGGYKDEDGYCYIMGRVDDVINVAGHRLSTGAMEEIIATHPDVAECAVFGVEDSLKGQVPIGLFVLKAGVTRTEAEIAPELVKMVRDLIGAIACFKQAGNVKRLPKTRSGKILRGTMRKIADGQPYSIPSTIDDPAILGEVAEALKGIGYAQKK